jgi:tRNA-Thr(GGU) m(6)t(6)A37 methyltransferase TsaA
MSFRDPTRARNDTGKVCFNTIGYVTSPYQDPTQVPMIPLALNDTEGTIEILEPYVEGIEKLESFNYIYVVYHLHRPIKTQLKVTPPFQNEEYGVFATRFNCRPNAIAMSILQLVKVEGNVLHVRGIDMIDGEAVLDIKPYIDDFDKVT